MSSTYIPGVCNIGPAEIKLRKLSGLIGLSVAIILFMILSVGDLPHFLRLFLLVPITVAAVGYLQAWSHFCVRFGSTGLFNVSSASLKRETVEKAEYRQKDVRKAVIMIASSATIGIVLTILIFILP